MRHRLPLDKASIAESKQGCGHAPRCNALAWVASPVWRSIFVSEPMIVRSRLAGMPCNRLGVSPSSSSLLINGHGHDGLLW